MAEGPCLSILLGDISLVSGDGKENSTSFALMITCEVENRGLIHSSLIASLLVAFVARQYFICRVKGVLMFCPDTTLIIMGRYLR